MKLLSSLFSCVYSRVKSFVFAMSSRRRYYILWALFTDQKKRTENQKLSLPFACRLPLTSFLTSLIKPNVLTSPLKYGLQQVEEVTEMGEETLKSCVIVQSCQFRIEKAKKVRYTQSKHFQVISLPGRRNEKQRREIWWRKIRSSPSPFFFVCFVLFVCFFFCVTEQEKDRRRNERLLVGLSYCEDDTTKWNCT